MPETPATPEDKPTDKLEPSAERSDTGILNRRNFVRAGVGGALALLGIREVCRWTGDSEEGKAEDRTTETKEIKELEEPNDIFEQARKMIDENPADLKKLVPPREYCVFEITKTDWENNEYYNQEQRVLIWQNILNSRDSEAQAKKEKVAKEPGDIFAQVKEAIRKNQSLKDFVPPTEYCPIEIPEANWKNDEYYDRESRLAIWRNILKARDSEARTKRIIEENPDLVRHTQKNTGILWPPRLIDALNTGALPMMDTIKMAHDSGASGSRGKMPNHNITTMHSGELTDLRDQLAQAKIELNSLTIRDNQYEMAVPMAKILWWIAQISRAVSGNMDLHNYLYSAAGVLLSHGIATPISGRQVPGMAHARKNIAKQWEQVTQTAERAIDMQIEHIDRKLGTTTNDT